MALVEETARKPNYEKDIEYGKVAEEDFEEISKKFEDKGYTVFDVRKEKIYQNNDIDYVIDKEGKDLLPSFESVMCDKRYQKIEVKLDGRGFETGNFPYEVISHSSSGWCITTKCDYVYFVLTESNTDNILKRGWIDMEKWHEYCANRKMRKKLSYIKSEKGIVDLLCNMEDMEKKGVLKWINKIK